MALAGPYFTDELADLGSKDSLLHTQGVWIIERSELDSLGRAEMSRIKAFMSRTTDRFRLPYIQTLHRSLSEPSKNSIRPQNFSSKFLVKCTRKSRAQERSIFRFRLRILIGADRLSNRLGFRAGACLRAGKPLRVGCMIEFTIGPPLWLSPVTLRLR
jgi:Virulence-associated protein E-like domain